MFSQRTVERSRRYAVNAVLHLKEAILPRNSLNPVVSTTLKISFGEQLSAGFPRSESLHSVSFNRLADRIDLFFLISSFTPTNLTNANVSLFVRDQNFHFYSCRALFKQHSCSSLRNVPEESCASRSITDMDGSHESSTCRSDPFATDLHNVQYWFVPCGLPVTVPRYYCMSARVYAPSRFIQGPWTCI